MADLSNLSFSVGLPNCFSPRKDVKKQFDGDNDIVKLCVYDWTIENYSMIKPVSQAVSSPEFFTGLNDEACLKIMLSPSSDNNLKIEILFRRVKCEESSFFPQSKSEESSFFPKILVFNKVFLNLEFLDSSGKTLDYFISLPYESIYVDKIKNYQWKKENITRFLQNDVLMIRVKLSLSYPQPCVNKLMQSKSSELLTKDMKKLLGGDIFPDIAIKVGGQRFLAHKAILLPQLVNIKSDVAEQNEISVEPSRDVTDSQKKYYETINIPNVNAGVFLSVLHYLYCGKMCASDAAAEFSLYDFAKRYQLIELCRCLKPDKMHASSLITPFKSGFYWYVDKYSIRCQEKFNITQSPGYRFRVGNEYITWSVSLFFFDPQNIYLSLKRLEGIYKDVQAVFKLAVCSNDGTPKEEREFKHLFVNNKLNSYPGFLDHESRFSIEPCLLYDDTLTIRCDITVSDGQVTSTSNRIYPGDTSNFGFKSHFKILRNLFETENFSDVSLLVDDKKIRAHKFILCARSPVFARMFESDMAEKLSGCVNIEDVSYATMKCALTYIYTAKLENLTMDHAPELYRTADKYEILDLKDRCRKFMIDNLDPDYACEVMILSDLYNDAKMKEVSKNLICRRAGDTLLTPHGLDMIKNDQHIAKDILDTLSAVFCSLPPQEVYRNVKIEGEVVSQNEKVLPESDE